MIIKKKIFFIITLLTICGILLPLQASNNVQKNIIDATKNIEYLSQNIAKDYLYLYHNPDITDTKTVLLENIKKLEENFRFIAKNTNNLDSKNILDFLSYSKDQIKEIIDDQIKPENRELILDQVEALSEGAQSILISYNYDPLKDRDIKINLAAISKYYMSIYEDINPTTNRENLQKEIKKVDTKLMHSSPKILASWSVLKSLLREQNNQFIPNIISLLVKNIEKITKT